MVADIPEGYCIRDGYRSRAAPEYFVDDPADALWQPDVYPDAAEVAQRLGATSLVDLGCGRGDKLVRLSDRFSVIGIDFQSNIASCRERFPRYTWIEHDLEVAGPLPVSRERLEGSVLICSDVIEHLIRPEVLLQKLRGALVHARAVVLSTPERDLTHGPRHDGPPPNACHVREWNRPEFDALLERAGFAHRQVGLTRSNDRDPRLRTILAFVYPKERALRRSHVPSFASLG